MPTTTITRMKRDISRKLGLSFRYVSTRDWPQSLGGEAPTILRSAPYTTPDGVTYKLTVVIKPDGYFRASERNTFGIVKHCRISIYDFDRGVIRHGYRNEASGDTKTLGIDELVETVKTLKVQPDCSCEECLREAVSNRYRRI